MSTFEIKVIAIVTMLIDHIGLAFFFPLSPGYLLFRLIGRLSFPLFAWLIANGARHTKNSKKYAVRLFAFALISQFPFLLFHQQRDPTFFRLNIFFTLCMGLLIIVLLKRIKGKLVRSFIILAAVVMAEVFQFEYGGTGMLVILIFYYFFNNIRMMFLTLFTLFLIVHIVPAVLEYIQYGIIRADPIWLMQPLAVVSLLFILMYNGKEGIKLKYFFYLFYPFHLFLLYVIKLFLQGGGIQ